MRIILIILLLSACYLDALEEIKNAALDAGDGDYNALQIALGISK
jgi:hypothetical protein